MPVQVPFKVSKGLMVLKLWDLAFICHNILSQDVNNGSNVIIRLLDHSTWEEFPPYLVNIKDHIFSGLHSLSPPYPLLLNTIKIIFSSKWMICVLTSRGNDCHQIFACWANHWYDLCPLLTRPITLHSVSGFAESLCPVSGNILIKYRVFNWAQNIKSTPAECPVAQANQAEVTNTPWHAACLQRPVLELLRFIC